MVIKTASSAGTAQALSFKHIIFFIFPMDAPDPSASQDSDERNLEGLAAHGAGPALLETIANLPPGLSDTVAWTFPNSGQTTNDGIGIALEQNTDSQVLYPWDLAEFDFSVIAQQAAAGPSVPATAFQYTTSMGEGQMFNSEAGISTLGMFMNHFCFSFFFFGFFCSLSFNLFLARKLIHAPV